MPILSRRFLGLCYGVQTRSVASCLRHQPRQEPRALTRMRGSVRGDWRKPVPYRDAIFARQGIRNPRNPQLERGEVRIEDIELDIKCRDDFPALLIGLQHLYSQEALRDRILALMDKCILPGVNKKKSGTSGYGDVEHSGASG